MATYRPSTLTDADVARIEYNGVQDRYRDPKSRVIVIANASGPTFILMVHKAGKQKQVTLGRYRRGMFGLADARKKAIQVLAQSEQGVVLEADKPTFKDAWHKLELRHQKRQRQPRTLASYQRAIEYHTPTWWSRPLDSFARPEIMQVHDRITANGTPAAANGWLRAVSPVFGQAVLYWPDVVPHNPALGDFMNDITKPHRVITDNDVRELWSTIRNCVNQWKRFIWTLALLTGLRKNDILTMRWEHVDLGEQTVFLPSPKGGPRKAFTLPLSDQAVQVLRDIPRLNDWVFPAQTSWSKKGHAHKVDAEGLTNIHQCRHIWSTYAERAGVDPYRRAILLNQVPGIGVNERYTHVRALEFRAEMQRAADAIWGLRD